MTLAFTKRFLINLNQRKQENQKKKIEFLRKQGYEWFYANEIVEPKFDSKLVNIPEFVIKLNNEIERRRRATFKVNQAIENIIRNNCVDYCYNLRMKELKRLEKEVIK